MITYILFIIGFYFLIKGADLLVEGSSAVARNMRIPSIVIGLTIVSFGTSSPEFVVNILASMEGNADIAIGNIIGSNIANILLILGVASLVYPLTTKKNTVWKEIPFSLLSALVLGLLANDVLIDGQTSSALTRIDGFVLLSFFIIFMYYTFGISKVSGEPSQEEVSRMSYLKASCYIVIGLVALIIGGSWIVDGAIALATYVGVSQSLISFTVVAIGTSLPELATSVIAAYKKEVDIAIGNVVGSNIFNIFCILGISSLIRPLPFHEGVNSSVAVVIVASTILFFVMFVGKRHTLERWQGASMLLLYVSYLIFLVTQGQ